ncbi:MAG: hypothetical protein Q8L22_07425 [Reyranella sp.]|nr:hypothetical protein [Reyranella sp.]
MARAPPRSIRIGAPDGTDRVRDVIDHTVGHVLDPFDIDTGKVKRWS